ncbi:MAG TPA: murein biosynthesis integral membrane protein MurJ, partial [Thermotogota bacterium]|nr:murein biosynthesis integral membrane protein MurJ [Thermotogota bacterium]
VSKTLRFSIQMALATLISRILGLVRDMLFAKEFGASPEYDAYLVAILLPFFLRKIFAEGALSSAFIPLYNKRAIKGVEKGHRFAKSILTIFIPVLLILTILSIYFMPQILSFVAPGLMPGVKGLAVFMGRLIFPFILFISLWAVYAGMLNSHDIFFTPALSPAIHNIFIIIGISLSPFFDPPILGPAIFFIIGGAAQWLMVVLAARGIQFKFTPSIDKKDISDFMPIFLSSFAALSVTQINSIVDTNVVSGLGTGSVSLLQYANRLFQLPLGVFAISVSTVALAQLSKNSPEEFKKNLAEGIERMALFVLPASIGLFLLRQDIITLLFQRGQFSLYDSIMTSDILMGYLIGLPFYSLYSLLSRAEYAIKKPRIVFLASTLSVGVNIFLDITLSKTMGPLGVALATSFAGITGFTVLLVHLYSIELLRIKWSNTSEILKSVAACFTMGLFIVLTNSLMVYSVIGVLLKITLSVAILFLTLFLLKQKDFMVIYRRLFRK